MTRNTESGEQTDQNEFGRLIKARRIAKGWSQEALAANALRNPDRRGHISNYENGHSKPNPFTVQSLCSALEIDRSEIPVSLRWVNEETEEASISEIFSLVGEDQNYTDLDEARIASLVRAVLTEQTQEHLIGIREAIDIIKSELGSSSESSMVNQENWFTKLTKRRVLPSLVFVGVAVTSLTLWLLPRAQGCAAIPTDSDQPFYGDWDLSNATGDRDCLANSPVALEFFNIWDDSQFERTLTSANFLIDGNAASPQNSESWHEYSRFTVNAGNRFDWEIFRQGRERFHQDGCGFDRMDAEANKGVEYRRGVFLLSNPRTDFSKHTWDEFVECNNGGPEFEEFSHCQYIKLELFCAYLGVIIAVRSERQP